MSLKKKKAGVLLATMCTAFFAGCGGDNKSADSTSGKKVQIEYLMFTNQSGILAQSQNAAQFCEKFRGIL